jgi:2-amino-4-hydroxy-6-hydroxymethyldihydropteridine diphosphokinase
MKTAYIGIGSNLGDKVTNCINAMALTQKIPGCRFKARSPLYLTEPIGVDGQDWYVNGVISLSTENSAQDLLRALLTIETDMGRKRRVRWDSRTIDLDILLYGQDIINEKGLVVPHQHMHLRRFVMVPMAQLAPDLIHPVLGRTMRELLGDLPGGGQAVIETEER